jgi:hypothetical protein
VHIGVDGDNIGSLQSIKHDAVERVQTGSAHANNFD